MSFETFITPPMPHPGSFERLGWVAKFSFVKRLLRGIRREQIEQMLADLPDVERSFCELLNASWESLDWGKGTSIDVAPCLITAQGNELLDGNIELSAAATDIERIRSEVMSEIDFIDCYGYGSSELYRQQLEYLESLSPGDVVKCEQAELHEFENGWGLILGRINRNPVVACLGIYPDPIDAYFPSEFQKYRMTKPIWDRFDEVRKFYPWQTTN